MKIESVHNKTIKELSQLRHKKNRDQSGLFLVEGLHCIQEAAKAGILKQIYTTQSDPGEIGGIQPVECSDHVLEKLSLQKSQAHWIGVCEKPEYQIREPRCLLVLQSVQDPGNLGTLIRCAVAFGADGVICSEDCADFYNPKTIQSAQGALFHIPCIQRNVKEYIHSHPEICFYATALHSSSIPLKDTKFVFPCALVLGNEGQGLPDEIISACSETVTIEMAEFESLNVAVAGSICLYQMYLQQTAAR